MRSGTNKDNTNATYETTGTQTVRTATEELLGDDQYDNWKGMGVWLLMPNILPLTLVLLKQIYPAFANSVDPGQLASEEAN